MPLWNNSISWIHYIFSKKKSTYVSVSIDFSLADERNHGNRWFGWTADPRGRTITGSRVQACGSCAFLRRTGWLNIGRRGRDVHWPVKMWGSAAIRPWYSCVSQSTSNPFVLLPGDSRGSKLNSWHASRSRFPSWPRFPRFILFVPAVDVLFNCTHTSTRITILFNRMLVVCRYVSSLNFKSDDYNVAFHAVFMILIAPTYGSYQLVSLELLCKIKVTEVIRFGNFEISEKI